MLMALPFETEFIVPSSFLSLPVLSIFTVLSIAAAEDDIVPPLPTTWSDPDIPPPFPSSASSFQRPAMSVAGSDGWFFFPGS